MTLQHNTWEYVGANQEKPSLVCSHRSWSLDCWEVGTMAVNKQERGDSEQALASRSLSVRTSRKPLH